MDNEEKIKILKEEINKYEVAIKGFEYDLEKAKLLDDEYNIKHISESIAFAGKKIENYKSKLEDIQNE